MDILVLSGGTVPGDTAEVPLQMFWRTSIDGGLIHCNRAWTDYTGLTLEDSAGLGWLQVIPPEDRAALQAVRKRALRSNDVWRLEVRIRRAADGEYRWHLVHGSPVLDADGRIVERMGTAVDIHERKRAEQLLADSEERYRYLFNAIDEGFCVIEVIFNEQDQPCDWLFVEVNPAFERHNGVKDAVGKRVLELVPDIEPQWFQIYGTVARTGIPSRFCQQSEALRRWFDVYAFRIGPAGSARVGVLFSDITLRIEAESALRESEQRMRLFIENAPAAIAMLDCEMRYLAVSRRWISDFGLADEVIGRRQDEVFPSAPPSWREAAMRALAGETAKSDGEVVELGAGDVRSLKWEIRPWHDDATMAGGIMISVEDITALANSNRELEAEKSRLSAVIDNVPVGLVFADASGRILSGNAQAERIFRHPVILSPDLESYNAWIAYHPDGRPVRSSEFPLTQTLADGEPHQAEQVYQRGDGELGWVEFKSAPIRNRAGEMTGAVVMTTDIDARKRAEAALLRSEKLAVVGRMAASISHEINNPLEAVTNLLFLCRNEPDRKRMGEYLEMAEQELARVGHVATHTLRFNRQSFAATRERVCDIIDSALSIYEGRLRLAGIEIVKDYSTGDDVLCFGAELRQVFANLCGNAFDALKVGGRLMLRTRPHRHPRTGEMGVRATVADTGCGMSKATLARIFDAFYTTKGDNGTGLGLWVSRDILTRHQAIIGVKSCDQLGASGTTFSIWFPKNPEFTSSAPAL